MSFKSTKSGTIKTTKFDYFCKENHPSKVKDFDKNKGIRGAESLPVVNCPSRSRSLYLSLALCLDHLVGGGDSIYAAVSN